MHQTKVVVDTSFQPGSPFKKSKYFMLFLMCVIFFGFSLQLAAQIDRGGVAGTVRDPSGAVVAGAQLTLTNEATGISEKARASSSGTYVFEAVLPGTYTLRVEARGFGTYIANGLQVHIQSVITADVQLTLGSVSQQVTVTSAAPLLQAQDASLGQTVSSAAVNDLPLNGRNWLSLTMLAAGTYVNPGSSPNNVTSVLANGAENGQVDFRLNGINDNGEVFGGTTVAPVPDAIVEFKLQDGNNSAEFGHSAGAVVNAAVKSGTNSLRGDVWEYFRNEALNANDYFSNLHHLRRQEYRQNQFGGTLGGPVYIPHLYNGKNKTFFFFDYQRTPFVQSTSFTDSVPTASMRSSNFTNLQDLINANSGTGTDGLGRKFPHGTVLDPATTRAIASGKIDPVTGLVNTTTGTVYVRDPFYTGSLVGTTNFVGATSQLNIIPTSRIDPNVVKLLQLLPAPTSNGITNNYFVAPLQHSITNQYDIRIDHTFSARDSVFGVFSRSTQNVTSAQPFAGAAGGALQIAFATTQPVYVLALSYTHAFSPTFINEARFGIDHNYNTRILPTADAMGLPEQYGIQGIPQIPNNGGLPTFNVGGFSAFGGRRFSPTIQTTGAYEYSDNVTKIHGNHELKVGFQLERIIGHIVQPAYSRGNFTFSGQYTDIPNLTTGLTGIADMELIPTVSTVSGLPGITAYDNLGGLSSYNGSNYAGTNYSSYYTGIFAQDSWKATPTLTLNLGLRWDYFSPFNESNGRQANFIMDGGNGSTGTYYIAKDGCNVPRSAGFNSLLASYNIQIKCLSGDTVYNAQTTNFAPRLGIAYRLFPNLAVRAGYGIAYGAFDSVGYGGTLGTNYPFQYTLNSPNTTSLVPVTLSNNQTATIENTFGTINLQDSTLINGKNLSLSGKQYNYQTPYIQSLNLNVQYQFTKHDSIQAGYVGSLGRHLDTIGQHNAPSQILPTSVNQTNYRPLPTLAGGSQYFATNAKSSYQSLQTVYTHQFDDGLGVLANYTYGKCMSNDAGKGPLSGGFRAQWLTGFGIKPDYSLCPSDATHAFHLSGQYALPIGKGSKFLSNANNVANAFVSGWHLNFIYIYQSGQPFNVGCPLATSSDFGCNANLVPGQNPYAGPHNRTQWLNPSAFTQPPAATAIGQTDYSVLGGKPQQVRGPTLSNVDASFFKQFKVSDQTIVEFRAEAFNLFNRAQFGQPGQLNFTNLTAFSSITSLRSNPRLGQLALKLYF
ncbi:TonB-dependent receptor [Edaphobacter bradus]|uniref:TonB-dependent receptor n=1 Tax=Edaphobacter bradus TaxID=2259016 RepID=UPI0021E07341|nr:TonB-dependent receptor [Edaphobacter bradus]